jgi:hypothetical protein
MLLLGKLPLRGVDGMHGDGLSSIPTNPLPSHSCRGLVILYKAPSSLHGEGQTLVRTGDTSFEARTRRQRPTNRWLAIIARRKSNDVHVI